MFRDAAQLGGKRDTPIDYKLAHLHSQLSYVPDCGPVWNRRKYYNTDLGFVKDKMRLRRSFTVGEGLSPARAGQNGKALGAGGGDAARAAGRQAASFSGAALTLSPYRNIICSPFRTLRRPPKTERAARREEYRLESG